MVQLDQITENNSSPDPHQPIFMNSIWTKQEIFLKETDLFTQNQIRNTKLCTTLIFDFIREMLRLSEGLKFLFLLASGFHPSFEAFLWFLAIRIRKFCRQPIVSDLQFLFRPLKHWMIFHHVLLIFRIVYSLFPQYIY